MVDTSMTELHLASMAALQEKLVIAQDLANISLCPSELQQPTSKPFGREVSGIPPTSHILKTQVVVAAPRVAASPPPTVRTPQPTSPRTSASVLPTSPRTSALVLSQAAASLTPMPLMPMSSRQPSPMSARQLSTASPLNRPSSPAQSVDVIVMPGGSLEAPAGNASPRVGNVSVLVDRCPRVGNVSPAPMHRVVSPVSARRTLPADKRLWNAVAPPRPRVASSAQCLTTRRTLSPHRLKGYEATNHPVATKERSV